MCFNFEEKPAPCLGLKWTNPRCQTAAGWLVIGLSCLSLPTMTCQRPVLSIFAQAVVCLNAVQLVCSLSIRLASRPGGLTIWLASGRASPRAGHNPIIGCIHLQLSSAVNICSCLSPLLPPSSFLSTHEEAYHHSPLTSLSLSQGAFNIHVYFPYSIYCTCFLLLPEGVILSLSHYCFDLSHSRRTPYTIPISFPFCSGGILYFLVDLSRSIAFIISFRYPCPPKKDPFSSSPTRSDLFLFFSNFISFFSLDEGSFNF